MKDIRFEAAFSPVPPAVHARVENTLQEVRNMSMEKAKPVAAIVLAVVLALALAGAALAAAISGGVLDFMFGESQPPDELREMLRPVGVGHESDGITTTVVDTLFDGKNVSVGIAFDTEMPVYVVMDSITVNGADLWVETSNIENMWAFHPVTQTPERSARGVSGALDAEYLDLEAAGAQAAYEAAARRMREDGKADVSLHLTLLTPVNSLELIDVCEEDSVSAWRKIDACVAAGNTPIDADEPHAVLVGSQWLGDAYSDGMPAGQHPIGDASAYVRHANMKVLDRFQLDFTLDADTSRNLDRTPKHALNDGRTHIQFNEVSFTPLRSVFDFTITADGMTMEEIESTYRWFAFYAVDESGKKTPLAFEDTFYLCDSGPQEQPDGSLALRAHYRMPAMTDIPDVIAIVPYNEESGAGSPLWDYAIYIQGN